MLKKFYPPLKNKRILITAGPTREYLDPVRFLSNDSSGAMGFAIANALKARGARVLTIAGPTKHKPTVRVCSALEMSAAVKKNIKQADVFIATAAVSDWRFERRLRQKMKKGKTQTLCLKLIRNPDILAEAGLWKKKKGKPLLVGFALETTGVALAARKKMKEKNLDLIIGNTPDSFGSSRLRPYWLERSAAGRTLPVMTKKALAQKITAWLERKLK